MTKSKFTKRALVISTVCLMLCVTMLIGSTFAWFTDNASTAVSNIVAGTLDIELLDGNTANANSLEGKTLTFAKAADAPANEEVLFEPGARYALQQVWLHNAGNLNAKYQISITGIDGSSLLANALDVYVDNEPIGTLAQLMSNGAVINSSVIAPGAYYSFGTIELAMQTNAGNEYQGLTMAGIAIHVQATQAAVEYDSDDNQYDAGAEFDKLVVAATPTELNDAIADTPVGEAVTVILGEGTYTLPKVNTGKTITIQGTGNTTIDMTSAVALHGCTVIFEDVTVTSPATGNYTGLQHTAKVVYKNCVINGQQFMYAPEVAFVGCTFNNTNNAYCIWTYGATNVNFTNCTFNTGGKAVLVYTEAATTATIGLDNCTFNDDGSVDTKKGAVEIGCNSNVADGTYYTLYMNDCTVNGFAVNDEGTSTGSIYWGNKNSMNNEHLNVVIDGVDVY